MHIVGAPWEFVQDNATRAQLRPRHSWRHRHIDEKFFARGRPQAHSTDDTICDRPDGACEQYCSSSSGSGSGSILQSAAQAILQVEGHFMTAGDIAQLALHWGLYVYNGKAPEAMVASLLHSDMKHKGGSSTFVKWPHNAKLFGLRVWLQDGQTFNLAGYPINGGASKVKMTSPKQQAWKRQRLLLPDLATTPPCNFAQPQQQQQQQQLLPTGRFPMDVGKSVATQSAAFSQENAISERLRDTAIDTELDPSLVCSALAHRAAVHEHCTKQHRQSTAYQQAQSTAANRRTSQELFPAAYEPSQRNFAGPAVPEASGSITTRHTPAVLAHTPQQQQQLDVTYRGVHFPSSDIRSSQGMRPTTQQSQPYFSTDVNDHSTGVREAAPLKRFGRMSTPATHWPSTSITKFSAAPITNFCAVETKAAIQDLRLFLKLSGEQSAPFPTIPAPFPTSSAPPQQLPASRHLPSQPGKAHENQVCVTQSASQRLVVKAPSPSVRVVIKDAQPEPQPQSSRPVVTTQQATGQQGCLGQPWGVGGPNSIHERFDQSNINVPPLPSDFWSPLQDSCSAADEMCHVGSSCAEGKPSCVNTQAAGGRTNVMPSINQDVNSHVPFTPNPTSWDIIDAKAASPADSGHSVTEPRAIQECSSARDTAGSIPKAAGQSFRRRASGNVLSHNQLIEQVPGRLGLLEDLPSTLKTKSSRQD